MNYMEENELWTGLVNIAPKKNCKYLSQKERAYSNILIYAVNEVDFKVKSSKFLDKLGFIIIKIEDVETITSLKQKSEISKEISRLILLVENEKTPKLTKLHVYDNEL